MQKLANSQWKEPKQSRSKALVDSIFEATVRILPKVGSYKITTKKIAEVAGVSIGSLYQYFPNKEALLGALMDQGLVGFQNKMNTLIDSLKSNSSEELIDSCVDLTLHMMLEDKAMISEIYRQVPELGRLPSIFAGRQAVVERIAIELEKHHPGFEKPLYLRSSFIGCNAVMGIVQTMLYDKTQIYTIEELSQELKIMVTAYLRERIKPLGSGIESNLENSV